MILFRLFLDETDEGVLGRAGMWRYDREDQTLETVWLGKANWVQVKPRSAVVVKCAREGPVVEPLLAPHGLAARLLWLAGVPKAARCRSREVFDRLVESWEGPPLEHLGGQGWQVARTTGPEGREAAIAGWVDPRSAPKELRRMIRACGKNDVPEWYIKELVGNLWK